MLFCTISDVADFLQIEVDEPSTARAITEATAAIKNYCHQVIEQVVGDVYTFDVAAGRSKLFLPELPVTAVATVVEDGETLVEGSDEDYQVANHGVLHRVGQNWEAGVQIVVVTYTHGYEDIPDDVVSVCTRAAARAYQAGLKADEDAGVPGIASKSLGDFSVTYASGAGGVGEGVMGASGSRMLLLSEKDTLDKYRYIKQ
jgi:hypothetical protein